MGGDVDTIGTEHLDGQLGEIVGRHRPRGLVLCHHNVREEWLEDLEQAIRVLVAEYRNDSDEPTERERLSYRRRRRTGAGRIVGRVDKDRR